MWAYGETAASAFGFEWQKQNNDDPRWQLVEVAEGYFENNEVFFPPYNPKEGVMLRILYRDCGDHYRVWRSDWSSDSFERVDDDKLTDIIGVCETLAIPTEEVED